MIYSNRSEAGKFLAVLLTSYADRADVLVLALPRGGVPVAFEVAKELRAPLDIFLVRKLGLPGHEEFAIGAIATGGVRVLNDDVVDYLGISDDVIDSIAAKELRELERRERAYRGDRRELSYLWMTDSQPVRPCAPPRRLYVSKLLPVSSSPFQSQLRKPAMNTEWALMRSFAQQLLNDFMEWDDGIATSRKRVMTKYANYSNDHDRSSARSKPKKIWHIVTNRSRSYGNCNERQSYGIHPQSSIAAVGRSGRLQSTPASYW
jgi:hypothetical protein